MANEALSLLENLTNDGQWYLLSGLPVSPGVISQLPVCSGDSRRGFRVGENRGFRRRYRDLPLWRASHGVCTLEGRPGSVDWSFVRVRARRRVPHLFL